MEKYLVVHVPNIVLAIASLVVAAALSTGGLLLVRRNVALSTLELHNDVAGFIIAVIGVLYSVVLGFLVVFVWEQYDTAKALADHEAVLVQALYRDAGAYKDHGADLRESIRQYADSVANQEWNTMAKHQHEDPRTEDALNRLWVSFHAVAPQSPVEQAYYAESLKRLGDIVDARRQRLFTSGVAIPGPLWTTLLAGGVITIGFTYFFGVANIRAHALMVIALSAIIGLALFLVLSLDFPFSGDIRVRPSAMHEVLRELPHLDAFVVPP